jgi:hypothetical protein
VSEYRKLSLPDGRGCLIVGTSFRQAELSTIAESRGWAKRSCRHGGPPSIPVQLQLIPDPHNEDDSLAVSVRISGKVIMDVSGVCQA